MSIFKNNVEKAFVVFNATNSNKVSWFDINRVIDSSYTDLVTSPKPTVNHFSLTGLVVKDTFKKNLILILLSDHYMLIDHFI